MQFSVVFPQTEFGNDPVAIRDYAQTAEALGYTYMIAYDHVLGANPDRPGGWTGAYTHQTPFHEVFVLFSFMAAVTHKLRFSTGILILPQRQTALVAKQAASLDVLSGGRLRLGVGLGWNQVEYLALNENFHNRGRRFEEQVQVLRLLWTQPSVKFEGKWHHIDDAGINPLPIQRPIPIWFGGSADPALERMARLADGWLPAFRSPADARPYWEKLQQYLSEAGRSPETLPIEPRIPYSDGNPENWAANIEGWQAMGAQNFSINPLNSGFTTPDAHIQALRRFAEAFMHS